MVEVELKELENLIKKQLLKLDDEAIEGANARIGAKLLALSKKTFSQQKNPFGTPWAQSEAAAKRGGQTLRDSGRLQNSIFVKTNNNLIRVFVQNLDYAEPHNEGFKGVVSVKKHIRTIRKAFGKRIQPRQVTVRAHAREMNVKKRQFIPTGGKIPQKWADIVAEEYAKIWSK